MKINKFYYLDRFCYPSSYPKIMRKGLELKSATQEQINECTIWHRGDLKPLVFHDKSVKGHSKHAYKTFYKGICWAIENFGIYNRERFSGFAIVTMPFSDKVYWGCRIFTLRDLRQIKKAMEFHWPELKGER